MDYCPHTPEDIAQMQSAIGISGIEELFADIPQKFRLREIPGMSASLAEQEIWELMRAQSEKNLLPRATLTGAGAYHHFIPAVVNHIVGRAEFYTAYTPYQAEMSQGILQAIYEYQTMIAHLTGTEIANASMYDGASAMAEAAVLCNRMTGRPKIIAARSVHPQYRRVLQTYLWANGCTLKEIPWQPEGQIDPAALSAALDKDTAAVIVQSPNFFGCIEDLQPLAEAAHKQGAMLIAGFTDATGLGILKPAGESGADFVVGEGQSFGNPLGFGGPYLGIFAAREKYLRRIPGRLAGATVDKNGRRGFVLTLQTREQHIRREKATSNICSNEALCALAAGVYLAALGKNLGKLALLNVYKTQYLKNKLLQIRGWREIFSAPVYNEFALGCPDARRVNEKLHGEGLIGGYELSGDYPELDQALLFCATEMLSKEDMDRVAEILN
ncbi:MAG TPA: aminomethyl-transferring glycine dehydrogenase subunit GcvPA [Smithellaceae bacterium]|nr:aminomethyl-transferring glycine dehydrogenase subunit GcvPA [Smithellaceae bacterium]HRV44244.1 aminomethyl-transferring glycine dehydrogenase subunit GcvPA [Smithellaceae bacterium]